MTKVVKVDNGSLFLLEGMKDSKAVNILYGAGSTGKECLKLFHKLCITIDFFCDDDSKKWNTKLDNIEIIPSIELIKISKHKKINIVMTSIYAKNIYKKIPTIENLCIYEVFSIYGENKGLAETMEYLTDFQLSLFMSEKKRINSYLEDEESKNTWDILADAIINKNKNIKVIEKIVSDEECYFIKEVLDAWRDDFVVVDGGAYTGEIISCMKSIGISYKKIYCFEVEGENFDKLKKNVEKNTICVQKALWDRETDIYLNLSGSETKIVDYETPNRLSAVSIDTYFQQERVDFIKMDIEGAEWEALHGSVAVIKRDRPILAISIYHSIEDLYRIPIFLREILDEYKFYVRHHSMIFCETVLYCIPNEKCKSN